MDARIEVEIMTAEAAFVSAQVVSLVSISSKVLALVTQTSTSILRSFLRQGRSSLSAVPGDNFILKGDAAVFA